VSLEIDGWYLRHLVCPRDHGGLKVDGGHLVCDRAHRYPVIDGVPIMLLGDEAATIDILPASLAASGHPDPSGLYLSTLSLSDDERQGILELARTPGAIDPVVAYLVAATNGLMYRHLVGRLREYPIPALPMPPGEGRVLLDVGCSWGRWTLAASVCGYDAVGIDPSLGAVLAARRVAAQLGRPVHYVVGDARLLPFPASAFDAVYSYSVIQHLSYEDAERSVREMGRVVRGRGMVKVQLPTRFGLRCLYHQLRRGFRAARGFEVRYWTWPRMARMFSSAVGPASLDVDGYFGIGLQPSDAAVMPPRLRRVLTVSEWLKRASHAVAPLRWVADSVFVTAHRLGDRVA
jgi:SAM-dependent methyltransferase